MKIFKDIQKRLKKTDPQMARLVGLRDARAWISFRDSVERVSTRPFIKLIKPSKLPAEAIIRAISRELRRK